MAAASNDKAMIVLRDRDRARIETVRRALFDEDVRLRGIQVGPTLMMRLGLLVLSEMNSKDLAILAKRVGAEMEEDWGFTNAQD